MIRKIAVLVIPLVLMQSCLGDPDPLPESIDTYHYYFNYLLEAYDLQWDIDETIIGSGHSYGVPAQAVVTIDEPEQKVLIQSRNSENKMLIDSLSFTLYENGAYMIALMGTEQEPHLICEPMDPRRPTTGMIKFRFLHTTKAMGPVDIYIGGDQPEHLALAAIDFTQVSDYLEATEEQLWASVIVTPANSLPSDSTILKYTANNVFQTGWIYLCILEHISSTAESAYQIQVHDDPVY